MPPKAYKICSTLYRDEKVGYKEVASLCKEIMTIIDTLSFDPKYLTMRVLDSRYHSSGLPVEGVASLILGKGTDRSDETYVGDFDGRVTSNKAPDLYAFTVEEGDIELTLLNLMHYMLVKEDRPHKAFIDVILLYDSRQLTPSIYHLDGKDQDYDDGYDFIDSSSKKDALVALVYIVPPDE